MLTAGGDTRALMIINSISVWLVCIIPSIVWLTYFPAEPYSVNLYVFPVYALVVTVLLYFRVRSGRWIKLNLAKAKTA